MLRTPALANISETCAIVNALESRTLRRLERAEAGITPRQLRYLEESDVLRWKVGRNGDGRLYDAEAVALIRIWLRLLVEALPDWAARAAVAYCREDLRREIQRGLSTKGVLVMRGIRGQVVPAAEAERMPATYKLQLVEVIRGVDEALTARRRDEPLVWTGRRLETGSTLATEVLRVG